jgi:hypothetical protein
MLERDERVGIPVRFKGVVPIGAGFEVKLVLAIESG